MDNIMFTWLNNKLEFMIHFEFVSSIYSSTSYSQIIVVFDDSRTVRKSVAVEIGKIERSRNLKGPKFIRMNKFDVLFSLFI